MSSAEGLFSGTRGKPVAGRFTPPSPTLPFPLAAEWQVALVATLEDALRLHRHQPGTLPDSTIPAPAAPAG